MVKGVNRNVIVMDTDKSSRFEKVYFIVKPRAGCVRADIIKEANAILRLKENDLVRRRSRIRGVLLFLAGAFSACCALTLVQIVGAIW